VGGGHTKLSQTVWGRKVSHLGELAKGKVARPEKTKRGNHEIVKGKRAAGSHWAKNLGPTNKICAAHYGVKRALKHEKKKRINGIVTFVKKKNKGNERT